MTQIDRKTDLFLPCSCGKRPSTYSIGYGSTPYYMNCECGKRMVDGLGGPESTFIKCWNDCVRHMVVGSYKTHCDMFGYVSVDEKCSKEDVFDKHIAPLLDRIHNICEEHAIAFVNSFSIGEGDSETLCSTGWNLAKEAKTTPAFKESACRFLQNVGVSNEDLLTGAMEGKSK